jgi:hypothetical protein
MSFKINKAHKFAEQYPKPSDKKQTPSDLLSSEDYLLFNLDNTTSGGGSQAAAQPKPRKGGNYIHPTNSAQADYY